MALDYTGVGAAQFDEPSTMFWGSFLEVSADTVLRIKLRAVLIDGPPATIRAGVVCYDQAGAKLADRLDISGVVTSPDWVDFFEVFDAWPAGIAYVHLVAQLTSAGSTLQVDEFSHADVTALVAADAAVISSTSAITAATAAGVSADASAAQRVLAQTAAGSASVYSVDAASSATAAAGFSVSALSYKNLAVAAADGAQASVTAVATVAADFNNTLSAGYLLKVQANGQASLLELIAGDGSGSSVSLAKVEATQILLNGTVTAGHIDVASFAVQGLGVFGGGLKSSNFNGGLSGTNITSNGTTGWALSSNGDMVLNNLVVRESLVVGSVTDGAVLTQHPSGGTQTNGSASAVGSLGAWTVENFWTLAWSAQYRHYGTRRQNVGGGQAGDIWQNTYIRTFVQHQYRTKAGGVWSSWIQQGANSPVSLSLTAYDTHYETIVLLGDFEDVQMRNLYYHNDYTYEGGTVLGNMTQANVKKVSLIGKAIVR